jgi:hypothetical protein
LKSSTEAFDFDFGRRVIARDSKLPEIVSASPQQPATLEALKASRRAFNKIVYNL